MEKTNLLKDTNDCLDKIKNGEFPNYEQEVKEILKEIKNSDTYKDFYKMESIRYKEALKIRNRLEKKYGSCRPFVIALARTIYMMTKGEHIFYP